MTWCWVCSFYEACSWVLCIRFSFSSRFREPCLCLLPWLRFLVSLLPEPLWVYFCYQRTKRWQVTWGAGLQLSAEGSWVALLSKPQGSYSRNVKRVGCWCPQQKRQYPAGPSAGPMPGLGGQSCTDSRCQKGGGGGAGCELLQDLDFWIGWWGPSIVGLK